MLEVPSDSAARARKRSECRCVQSIVEIWRAATSHLSVYGKAIAGECLVPATATSSCGLQAVQRLLFGVHLVP